MSKHNRERKFFNGPTSNNLRLVTAVDHRLVDEPPFTPVPHGEIKLHDGRSALRLQRYMSEVNRWLTWARLTIAEMREHRPKAEDKDATISRLVQENEELRQRLETYSRVDQSRSGG